MNETRTTSILQRVPVILAVTAASYGLNAQSATQRSERGERASQGVTAKADAQAGAHAIERMREAIAAQD